MVSLPQMDVCPGRALWFGCRVLTGRLIISPACVPIFSAGGLSLWSGAVSSSALVMSTQQRSSTPRSCQPEVGVGRVGVGLYWHGPGPRRHRTRPDEVVPPAREGGERDPYPHAGSHLDPGLGAQGGLEVGALSGLKTCSDPAASTIPLGRLHQGAVRLHWAGLCSGPTAGSGAGLQLAPGTWPHPTHAAHSKPLLGGGPLWAHRILLF